MSGFFIVFKVNDLKTRADRFELNDPILVLRTSECAVQIPGAGIHEGEPRYHFILEDRRNVHSVLVGQVTLDFAAFCVHFSFGGSWQIEGHALVVVTARFGSDSGLVPARPCPNGIACSADHTLNTLAVALGAGHLHGVLRCHEEFFEALAALRTSKLENGHCFSPVL
jgi:hypothetical protein